jgi:drug/metabolite transporter (DMT)-like permease
VRFRVWLAFGLLSSIWGTSYLFIRIGLRHLSPLALVGLRLGSAALAITVIAAILRLRLRVSRRELIALIVLANIYAALPFLLISWGEEKVPSGLAAVLNSTVPIFSVLLAGAALRDEPLTVSRLGGVVIGFAGVVLLLSRDLGHGAIQWSSIVSQGAIILSSISYACAAVFVRRALRTTPPLTATIYTMWISAAETLGLSIVFSRPNFSRMLGETWFAVLWLGLLGSAVGYMLAFFILKHWGAARYSLVAYMLPIVGLSAGAVVLGEVVGWRIAAGSALVILGVVLASLARLPGRSRPEVQRPATQVSAVD